MRVLILLNPTIWWMIFNLPLGLKEYSKVPPYFSQDIKGIFSSEKINFLLQMRSISSSPNFDTSLGKRLLFNKLNLIFDSIFNMLTAISPKTYFTVFDKVEIIPIILLPFWFSGIIILIQQKKYKWLVSPLPVALLIGILGKPNLFFLFPITLIYLYYCVVGIRKLNPKYQKLLLRFALPAYSTFLTIRLFTSIV
jgi:hypothetical protein